VVVAVAEPETLEMIVVEEVDVAVTLCVVVLPSVKISVSRPVMRVYGMVVVDVPWTVVLAVSC